MTRALIVLVLLLAGCATPGGLRTPLPSAAGIVANHEKKDATVMAEADRIDATVAGTPQAGEVRASTDAQRAAVEAAPAKDIASLVAAFEKALGRYEKRIAELETALEAERKAALREQVRWLNGAGIALLVAFGVSVGFGGLAGAGKTWPLVPLAAGCFGLAQVVGHPWFVRSFLGLLLCGIAYAAWWAFDKHRDGKLRTALERKAAKLQGVLGEVVPVLDAAYEKAGDGVRQILDAQIFDRLSDAFTKEQKATIHEIRSQA